ncbi:MAG: hypothetical protein AAGF77_09955, partial [Bacteroidota bacterium]
MRGLKIFEKEEISHSLDGISLFYPFCKGLFTLSTTSATPKKGVSKIDVKRCFGLVQNLQSRNGVGEGVQNQKIIVF